MSRSNGSQQVPSDSLSGTSAAQGLSISLPEVLLEVIAERAAAIVQRRQPVGADPWLGVHEAADHLACPASRIYALVSARRIPHHRDGSRLLFRRSELDAWVERGGATRP
jgi:excisionase family DNA binding protein